MRFAADLKIQETLREALQKEGDGNENEVYRRGLERLSTRNTKYKEKIH